MKKTNNILTLIALTSILSHCIPNKGRGLNLTSKTRNCTAKSNQISSKLGGKISSQVICETGQTDFGVPVLTAKYADGTLSGNDLCLTLSATKNAIIYYTVTPGSSGTEPNGNSNVYEKCIEITDGSGPNTTVRAYAIDASGLLSDPYKATFTINKQLPDTSKLPPAPSRKAVSGSSLITPQVLKINYIADVETRFVVERGGLGLLNSGSVLVSSVTPTPAGSLPSGAAFYGSNLLQGENTVWVYVINTSTLVYSAHSLKLYRDDTPPKGYTNITTGTYGAAQNVFIYTTGADEPYGIQKIVYSLSGHDPKTVSSTSSIIYNSATSKYGSTYCASASKERPPPSEACDHDPDGGLQTNIFVVEPHFKATDSTAVCNLGGSGGPAACAADIPLKFYMVDTAGNVSETQTVNYRIDMYAPAVSKTAISPIYRCRGTDTWTYSITPTDDNVQYQVAIGGSSSSDWNNGLVVQTGTLLKGADLSISVDCSQMQSNLNNFIYTRSKPVGNPLDGISHVAVTSDIIRRDDEKPTIRLDGTASTSYPVATGNGIFYPTPATDLQATFDIINTDDSTAKIYYTLNGADPTSMSTETSDGTAFLINFEATRTVKNLKAIAIDAVGNVSDVFDVDLDMIGTSEFDTGGAVPLANTTGSTSLEFTETAEVKTLSFTNNASSGISMNYIGIFVSMAAEESCSHFNPYRDGVVLGQGSVNNAHAINLFVTTAMAESLYTASEALTVCVYTKLNSKPTFDNGTPALPGTDPSIAVTLTLDNTPPTITFQNESDNSTRYLGRGGRQNTVIEFKVSENSIYYVHEMNCGTNTFGNILASGMVSAADPNASPPLTQTVRESISYSQFPSITTTDWMGTVATKTCFGIRAIDFRGNASVCGSTAFCGTYNAANDSGFIWRQDDMPTITATLTTCSTTECSLSFNHNVTSDAVTCRGSSGACPTSTNMVADTGTDRAGYVPLIRVKENSYTGLTASYAGTNDKYALLSRGASLFLPSFSPSSTTCNGNYAACITGSWKYNFNNHCSKMKPRATAGASLCWMAWGTNTTMVNSSHTHNGSTSWETRVDRNSTLRFRKINITWSNIFSRVTDVFTSREHSNIDDSKIFNSIDWSNVTLQGYSYSGNRIFTYENAHGVRRSILARCNSDGCLLNEI